MSPQQRSVERVRADHSSQDSLLMQHVEDSRSSSSIPPIICGKDKDTSASLHRRSRQAKRMIHADASGPKRGKWTKEEQTFADRLILDFEHGVTLGLENGHSLRAHLAERLQCNPMRITKRFVRYRGLRVVRQRSFSPSLFPI